MMQELTRQGLDGQQRLTNGKPALAHWKGDGRSRLAKCKVLAPCRCSRF